MILKAAQMSPDFAEFFLHHRVKKYFLKILTQFCVKKDYENILTQSCVKNF